MNIKSAIFDMDGTLIDSLGVWDVLWSSLGERYFNDESFRPSEQDDKSVRTLTLKDSMELIHSSYNIGESGEDLLHHAEEEMRKFYANEAKLKDGVREFLDYCLACGTKMCIASATAPHLLELALEHCDLKKYFLKIFSCADFGKGKESPDVFLAAIEFLGSSVHETWMFEDSLVAIRTAKGIGMPTVGIYDRFNYGQDEIEQISDEYIAHGETLLKLIK